MKLNTIKPHAGSKTAPKRLGRGIGSGLGKTSGKGHKGQKARSGGGVRIGFEGGQMPLQMRLPKFGFRSRISTVTAEVRLHELSKVMGEVISLDSLKASGIVGQKIQHVKIIGSGKIDKPVKIDSSVRITAGAKLAIEAAGGSVGA